MLSHIVILSSVPINNLIYCKLSTFQSSSCISIYHWHPHSRMIFRNSKKPKIPSLDRKTRRLNSHFHFFDRKFTTIWTNCRNYWVAGKFMMRRAIISWFRSDSHFPAESLYLRNQLWQIQDFISREIRIHTRKLVPVQ